MRSFPRFRAALVLAAAVISLAATAGAARAHAIIVESSPAANAAVPPGPLDVRLRFNSRIDRVRSRLTLVGPDKTERRLPLAGTDRPDLLNARIDDLAPGPWRLNWQVLSVDGHMTRGEVPFTIMPGAAPAAVPGDRGAGK